jgi:hypothetical protein
MTKRIAAASLALALSTCAAFASGDDGHKVIALIAKHYLTDKAKAQVNSLLATDTDPLSVHPKGGDQVFIFGTFHQRQHVGQRMEFENRKLRPKPHRTVMTQLGCDPCR